MTTIRPARPRTAATRSHWKSVALPSEHGGWGLTAEPVLLGLIVEWSAAGLALGVVALLAFLARTPVKIALADRWRGRVLTRTRFAVRLAGVELAAIAALLVVVVSMGHGRWWLPLLVGLPFLLIELWYDMRSRSRRLVPELAGALGISSVAAAIVLAGDGPYRLAVGLSVIAAARAVASIPFVRRQIKRAHGHQQRLIASDGAQVIGIGLAVVAWAALDQSVAAVVAIVVLATLHAVWARRTPARAVIIGVRQSLLGLAVVLAAALPLV